jgi:hypothetical protein
MYAQLDEELMCNKSKKEGRPSNFHEFWSEEVHYIKKPQRRKL